MNAVHVLAGYGAASFLNPIALGYPIHAQDLQELRDSLDVAFSALILPPITYTDALQAGIRKIRKQHVDEIRNALK